MVLVGKRMRLRRLVMGLCLLLAGGLVLAWLAGSKLVAGAHYAIALPEGLPAQTVTLPTEAGRTVEGWFLRGSGKGAVLLLHGIRADRRQMLGRARFLHAAGYSVLLIDLPGHGASAAPQLTFGLTEAAGVKAAPAYLRRQAPGQGLGLIGVSLGAASYVLCKDCGTVDAVVLESMYPTIEEAVEDRLRMRLGALGVPLSKLLLWQLPLRLDIAPRQLRPIDHLAAIRVPVLVASGDQDMHTTLAETRRLYGAAAQPKQLWVVQGAVHQDLHAFALRPYEERVLRFLETGLRGQGRYPAEKQDDGLIDQ